MTARTETLFHRQHLPHRQAVLAEQFVIAVDELGLPHCGKQLPLIHAVHLARDGLFQLASPAGHGTGRNQYDFDTVFPQFGNLVHQSRHACHVQSSVLTGQNVTSYLDGYAFILL